MASGRVEPRPPILKTLSSPQSGEGFPPLTHPTATAQPGGGSVGQKSAPWKTLKKPSCFQCFRVWAPKDPSRTFQGSPRTPQEPPRARPGPSKAPQSSPQGPRRIPNALPRTSKCSKHNKNHWFFNAFISPPMAPEGPPKHPQGSQKHPSPPRTSKGLP